MRWILPWDIWILPWDIGPPQLPPGCPIIAGRRAIAAGCMPVCSAIAD
eukprot:COSAG01_NODE_986_length_12320_cov_19.750818_6_plen_48_part_00